MSRTVYRIHQHDSTAPDDGTIGVYAEIRQLSEIEALYQYEDLITAPPEIQAFARVRMAALHARLFGRDAIEVAA